ncbi:MAG TPA: MBL fold metallo-hydrolase [Candidatus Sulfotelmatobacter sp.]|nr:MBL fold metallo-hydrolase [Candidatus Sulfotelmatobacter sp.]
MPDGIEINEKDVVALDNIAPGVRGLRIAQVNVYAVSAPGGWVLIDAGLPTSDGRIRRWGEKHFGGCKPSAILLTHGHFDHVGAFPQILDAWEWDVPVYAHQSELPYLRGQKNYPAPDPDAGGGLISLLAPFYPRRPINLGNRVQALPLDGSVPGLNDWRWIHTPGHAEGHVSFFRDSDRTLLVGDAFCTTKQDSLSPMAMQRPELHGPPAYYTSDWDSAKDSVAILAKLKPQCVAPGHGSPMRGLDVAPALDDLARNFDAVARPRNERHAA